MRLSPSFRRRFGAAVLAPTLALSTCSDGGEYASVSAEVRRPDLAPVAFDDALAALVRVDDLGWRPRSQRPLRFHAEGLTDPADLGGYPTKAGPNSTRAPFELDVIHDLHSGRLRIDRRTTTPGSGTSTQRTEIIDGRTGIAQGAGQARPPDAIPVERVAALVRRQRLLNPTLLLRQALREPAALVKGELVQRGRRSLWVFEIDDKTAPIQFEVELRGGPRIIRATTNETGPQLRRSVVEIRYGEWGRVPGFGKLPHRIEVWKAGHLVHKEERWGATAMVPLVPGEIPLVAEGAHPVQSNEGAPARQSSRVRLGSSSSCLFPKRRSSPSALVEARSGASMWGGTVQNSPSVDHDLRQVLVGAPVFSGRGDARCDRTVQRSAQI